MTSFILTAKDKKKREAYIKEYAAKRDIDSFDVTLIEKESSTKTTQSIGIETIKLIQQKVFLKPIKSANKLVVIEDAQLLTPEAQNALLKVLEEPPEHTFIFLGTQTKEVLLPTILSRCQIIELEDEQTKLSDDTVNELTAFIKNLPQLSIGDRLKYAEQLAKDKEKAAEWMRNIIIILRENLLQNYLQDANSSTSYVLLLKSFQFLHTLLQTTNVNPRFAIEHALLSL